MSGSPDAASVALIDGDRVLLVQRAREPFRGSWTLPGGRLEPGEDATAAAIREVAEELGLRVTRLRPLMQLPTADFVLQVLLGDSFTGEIRPTGEITAYGWFARDEIGALRTTPRLDEVLEAAFLQRHRR